MLLAAVLLVVSLFSGRVIYQQYTVNKEIKELQNQAEKIKKDNEQLTELIKYFGTQEYSDKQAREKLNLKKEGEFVVGLPQDSGNEQVASAPAQKSNLSQWFDYFFPKKD